LLNVPDVDRFNVVNVDDVNRCLSLGMLEEPGLFPRLETLRTAPAVFRMEFGLDQLPLEPGVIMIRGARQWVIETTLDWVQGECARSGRARRSLVSVMEQLHRHGGSPLGQTKLAREAGLANNTVAAGWIELLADLLCIGISPSWDASRRVESPRKPAKFPFINLLSALAWAPEAPRSSEEFVRMPPERQGVWYEWAVAQELFRRRALKGEDEPERIPFWQGADHEVDFVQSAPEFIEVELGRATALDFGWFTRSFPRARLDVVCSTPFETDRIRGITLHDFLLGAGAAD
jgi:uncharacterized protein